MNPRDYYRIGRQLALILLAAAPIFAQCPTGTAYPGALDTNATLTVAKNNLITTLTVNQQVADTVAIVASTTGWTANMMAAVDTGSAIEYEFVTGTAGANTLNVSRACEGSTAVIHLAGAPVDNNATAYSGHTSVTSPITAIETLIKANPTAHNIPVAEGTSPFTYLAPGASGQVLTSNGASADPSFGPFSALLPAGTQTQALRIQPNTGNNTTLQFTTLPIVNALDYNFGSGAVTAAYSCNAGLTCAPGGASGGSLVIGNNTLTMTPVPQGVNGTDAGHSLYVSGGTGAAEACLINGGAGTSGQTSGAIIINCANTHSGAWTIQSNSSGIQEAWNISLAAYIPPGSYNVFGSITPPTNATLVGGGTMGDLANNTVLTEQFTNVPLFNVINDRFRLNFMQLSQAGTAVSGSAGLKFGSAQARWADINNVNIFFFWNGILSTTLVGGSLNLTNVTVASSLNHGILAQQGWQGNWNTVVAEKNTGDGVHMDCNPSGCQGGWISGLQTFNNGGWGIFMHNVPTVIGGNGNSFNNDFSGEISASGSLQPIQITNAIAQSAGNSTSFGINTTAPGIKLDYDTTPTLLTNVTVSNSEGNGIVVTNTAQPNGPPQIDNVWVLGSGVGAVAGNTYALLASNPVIATNSFFIGPVELTGAVASVFGNNRISANTALPGLQITGTSTAVALTGNVIANAGAGVGLQCDSGSTLLAGINHSFPSTTNNCLPEANTVWTAWTNPVYIGTETGAANNLVASLPGVTVAAGLCVNLKIAHTLQAGANTFNLNGSGGAAIKSHLNTANNIATAYASGGILTTCYDGTQWEDTSQ